MKFEQAASFFDQVSVLIQRFNAVLPREYFVDDVAGHNVFVAAAHTRLRSPYTLEWADTFSSKVPLLVRESAPPSNPCMVAVSIHL